MTTLAEKIAVMQACENGEHIQYRNKPNGYWLNCGPVPTWDWYTTDYRVAPKRPMYRLVKCVGTDGTSVVIFKNTGNSRDEQNRNWIEHKEFNPIYLTDWLPLPEQNANS